METNKITQATAQLGALKTEGIRFVYDKGPSLAGAVAILIVGIMIARLVTQLLRRWLDTKDMEPPVRMLITRLVWLLIMVVFLVVAIGTVGINIAPVVAMMGVAGVGVGLAMQGVLGNLVSGLLIIFTKPFRVGEFIEIVGNHGQVTVIELFSTTLIHADRSRVIIPNRKIIGEVLHNYGTIRQHDISVGVAYNTDLPRTLDLLRRVVLANPKVLKDPAPALGVKEFGASSITLAVSPWSKLDDFGSAGNEIKLAIADAFRAEGIEMPFPQLEIRRHPGADLAAAG